VQHDVRDVCDMFAICWESGESIGRRAYASTAWLLREAPLYHECS